VCYNWFAETVVLAFFGETDQQVVHMQQDVECLRQSEVGDCGGGDSTEGGCCDRPKRPVAGSKTGCDQRSLEEKQAKMLAEEREEILRHKWIESEKAQRDLGAEAVLDWIYRYAAQWRHWYEDRCGAKKA
jgi:hypothetical protein